MADVFRIVNELSILLAGRRPEWIRQTDTVLPNGAPSVGDGVALRDAPRTQVIIDLREQANARTVRLIVRVLDLTAIYTATVAGTAVAFDAGVAGATTLQDVITGWAAAINADVTVGPIVTATPEDADGDGLVDTVLIRGDTEADYSISATATGTAEIDILADPLSADARIWLAEKPPIASAVAAPDSISGPTAFVGKLGPGNFRAPNGALYVVGLPGFAEFFDTAGYERLYVELFTIFGPVGDLILAPHTLTYTPRITVGPSILET